MFLGDVVIDAAGPEIALRIAVGLLTEGLAIVVVIAGDQRLQVAVLHQAPDLLQRLRSDRVNRSLVCAYARGQVQVGRRGEVEQIYGVDRAVRFLVSEVP